MAITPGDVAQYLRDYPQNNKLLDAVQFDEDEIDTAIRMAISQYNAIPPMTNVDLVSFPNDYILLQGAAAHLMGSEVFLQIRNQVEYQDGDVQAPGIDNKWAAYKQLSDALKADWTTAAQRLKQQQNMEGAYGSLSSGYRNLRTGYKDW